MQEFAERRGVMLTKGSVENAVHWAVLNRDRALDPADAGALQALAVTYGFCADFGLVDEIVELFEPDAVWDGSGFRFPRCSGHAEIRSWFGEVSSTGNRQVHVMNPGLFTGVEGQDHLARGVVPFNAMEAAPDGHGIYAAQHAYGLYEDEYAKRDGTWRFARRTLHLRLVRR